VSSYSQLAKDKPSRATLNNKNFFIIGYLLKIKKNIAFGFTAEYDTPIMVQNFINSIYVQRIYRYSHVSSIHIMLPSNYIYSY
jgi:hypothetical protein